MDGDKVQLSCVGIAVALGDTLKSLGKYFLSMTSCTCSLLYGMGDYGPC